MNREKIKALLPVFTAFSEGKIIQTQGIGVDRDKWWDNINPNWDLPADHYRVKPEPRVVWSVYNKHGDRLRTYIKESEAQACATDKNRNGDNGPYTIAKFVEQL